MREAQGIRWWFDLCRRFEIKPDHMMALFDAIEGHYNPPVERSDPAALAEGFARMREILDTLEENVPVTLSTLMERADMDPGIRSDRIRTRNYLIDTKLLERSAKTEEVWIKRLNGPSEGSA